MIFSLATHIIEWVRATYALRKQSRELNMLSDSDLKDIGLNRGDAVALALRLREVHQGS